MAHELRITNQLIYVNPPVEESRVNIMQELFGWEAVITSLPRIRHSRYQVTDAYNSTVCQNFRDPCISWNFSVLMWLRGSCKHLCKMFIRLLDFFYVWLCPFVGWVGCWIRIWEHLQECVDKTSWGSDHTRGCLLCHSVSDEGVWQLCQGRRLL